MNGEANQIINLKIFLRKNKDAQDETIKTLNLLLNIKESTFICRLVLKIFGINFYRVSLQYITPHEVPNVGKKRIFYFKNFYVNCKF